MNLTELNESYNEYILTEAYYLEEGLKYFKKSKKLKKLAEKITAKAATNPDLEAGAKALTNLYIGYKKAEDDFASNKITKAQAKADIKELKRLNVDANKHLKNAAFIKAAKIAGITASVVGAGLLLNHLQPQLFTGFAGKISSLFGKTKAGIAAAAEATGLKPEVLSNAPAPSGIDSAAMADGAMADKFRTPKVSDVKPDFQQQIRDLKPTSRGGTHSPAEIKAMASGETVSRTIRGGYGRETAAQTARRRSLTLNRG